jgi:hypothetical protein
MSCFFGAIRMIKTDREPRFDRVMVRDQSYLLLQI